MISSKQAEALCWEWGVRFEELFAPIEGCFARSESRGTAKAYVRGLMSEVKRKNGWQLAERLGMKSPLPLQRLLNEATWDADEVLRIARQLLTRAGSGDELHLGFPQPLPTRDSKETRGDLGGVGATDDTGIGATDDTGIGATDDTGIGATDDTGIGVVDESGFVKKGEHSAGVKRQYCGRLGKVENCQMGVFLGYVSPSVQGFLDRRLYLPREWCEDEVRCEAARIPKAARVFKTKPELALEMLKAAWAEGVELNWVTGDTLYGNSPAFRQGVAESGRYYVLAVTQNHNVRCRGHRRISALLATLRPEDWSLSTSRASEHGILEEQWAFLRVGSDQEQWLIFRRSEHDTEAYLSNAPETCPAQTLVQVILARHGIERCLQEAKSELGLADYEVRYFHAWQRHMALCLLAHSFLALCRYEQRKKNAPTLVRLPQPRRVPNPV